MIGSLFTQDNIMKNYIGLQINEIGEGEEQEKLKLLPLITYRKFLEDKLFIEGGIGYWFVGEAIRNLNIDILYNITNVGEFNYYIGPGLSFIDKTGKPPNTRIGFGLGIEHIVDANPFDGGNSRLEPHHTKYFRLYYPAHYSNSGNTTIAVSIGYLVTF